MSHKLNAKLLKGLKEKYNITAKDILDQEYKYAGGTYDENNKGHFRYWNILIQQKPYLKKPDLTNECVCGHDIIHNFYIINKYDNILVLGKCCLTFINIFIEKSKRTCGWCSREHRNTKFNLCNECKQEACKICGNKKEKSYYKMCNICYKKDIDEDYEEDGEYSPDSQVEKICKGNGECFEPNSFKRMYNCIYNCKLESCPDCKSNYPIWFLNCHDGYCFGCNISNFCDGKKIYLFIPYNEKEYAKNYGCKWDPDIKSWYFREKNKNKDIILSRWNKYFPY